MTVPDLLKIAKSLLTISTMWFGPTERLLSEGAELTVKVPWGPLKPLPTPSKLLLVDGIAGVSECPLVSAAGGPPDGCPPPNFLDGWEWPGVWEGGMLLSGGDVS